eukprot:gnl/TRDRNA2_/TRDRNA2_162517_c0_seq2.p2 gnl/TRDRNA2_/TRDRNA2_162517_c0~~gnl/TRDRNA2_/TRDRNA2_162517_c0_seq2.p2  ORF type:complete len:103 (+),score=10.79 gnl/TRDRNA2_/TRDRNA2_162517_c0_seq2:539-847(+)
MHVPLHDSMCAVAMTLGPLLSMLGCPSIDTHLSTLMSQFTFTCGTAPGVHFRVRHVETSSTLVFMSLRFGMLVVSKVPHAFLHMQSGKLKRKSFLHDEQCFR